MPDLAVHHFAHEAMTTRFEVMVAGGEARYAGEVAEELFREVDRYERLLSRHDPGSDISQINRLRPGESVRVAVETYECLRLTAGLARETGGAFDASCGPLLACWAEARRTGQATPSAADLGAARVRVGMQHLRLEPTPADGGGPREFAVSLTPESGGVLLDLGAIGKGFALDGLRETLHDWKVDNVLVHSGTSTALAFGPGADWGRAKGFSRARLRNAALSGSGVEVKGRHIVDPRTGQPVTATVAAWTLCASAAVADALSTAFMVFSVAEAEAFARRHPEVWAMTVRNEPPDGRPVVRTYGQADLLP
jgi:thiamine biosynthesis lipoprotein